MKPQHCVSKKPVKVLNCGIKIVKLQTIGKCKLLNNKNLKIKFLSVKIQICKEEETRRGRPR